jgi:hypothetical protein
MYSLCVYVNMCVLYYLNSCQNGIASPREVREICLVKSVSDPRAFRRFTILYLILELLESGVKVVPHWSENMEFNS